MNVKMFDVLLVDFNPVVIDNEQGGIRPAIVIQNDAGNFFSDTTIVFPLTKVIKNLNQPTHALIKRDDYNMLKVDSMVLGEQIRMISKKRIKYKIGSIVNEKDKEEILRVKNNI